MKAFILFINFSFSVASLGLTIQPNTFASRTLQPVHGDGALDANFRFLRRADVEDGDIEDAGIAVPEVSAFPTQQFGTPQVVFPTQGTTNVISSTSSKVDTTVPPTASATASVTTTTSQSTSVSSQPSATGSSSTSDSTRPKNKTPIIVGSIFLTIFLLAIVVFLIMFLLKRKRQIATRWTFNRELMVKGRRSLPPAPMAQRTPSSASARSRDPEQGLHTLMLSNPLKRQPSQESERHIITPYPFSAPITRPQRCRPALDRLQLDFSHRPPPPGAPTGPRSPLHRPPRAMSPGLRSTIHRSPVPYLPMPHSLIPGSPMARSPMPHSPIPRSQMNQSPIPRSPSPRTHRQRAIADQIEILRIQMLAFERKGGKEGADMDEMCKKLAWLREQQEGSWALGLTEVTPLGYGRYMT